MPTAAVVLAGCGYLDGSEIRESVLALLALDRAGVTVSCFAPDIAQYNVVDHLAQKPTMETRNVLVEAARLARSQVQPLSALDPAQFDMLVCPGGFGVAKNLSDLAFGGSTVLPAFAEVLRAFHDARKPICAICIAPAVVVAALGCGKVTIGHDAGTAAGIVGNGGQHDDQPVTGFTVDPEHRLVTTPAYMIHDACIADVSTGIDGAVRAAVGLV